VYDFDMTRALEKLPDNPQELQHIIHKQNAIIQALEAQLTALRRYRFGKSSEKLSREIEQLELLLDEMVYDGVSLDIPMLDDAANNTPKSSPSRQKLPAELPREEIVLTPQESCPQCGESGYSKIGEDVTETLEYVPARFKVLRHVRPKHSCRACETIRQSELPSMPITKGKAGAGLLAHIILSKYCDHLPLYRQSEIFAREGIHISRSSMTGWMRQIDALIEPLSEALHKDILTSEKLHGDDTTISVLAPGMGQTKTGRLWVYVRDDRGFSADTKPAAFYSYSENRQGLHPQKHLKGFKGILQADGYAGYNELYKADVTGAACWAHVRRKFYEDHEHTKSLASKEILQKISLLYDIERDVKGKPPDERKAIREEKALPLIDDLKTTMEGLRGKISGKSPLAGAIRYALNRMEALSVYVYDGRVEIDNNIAERAMRPIALGRKNYLFAGSDRGGKVAASFYSLIETCKLNNINPQEYFCDVLNRINDHPINRIHELLPQNWNTTHA
jgi:transposase